MSAQTWSTQTQLPQMKDPRYRVISASCSALHWQAASHESETCVCSGICADSADACCVYSCVASVLSTWTSAVQKHTSRALMLQLISCKFERRACQNIQQRSSGGAVQPRIRDLCAAMQVHRNLDVTGVQRQSWCHFSNFGTVLLGTVLFQVFFPCQCLFSSLIVLPVSFFFCQFLQCADKRAQRALL